MGQEFKDSVSQFRLACCQHNKSFDPDSKWQDWPNYCFRDVEVKVQGVMRLPEATQQD